MVRQSVTLKGLPLLIAFMCGLDTRGVAADPPTGAKTKESQKLTLSPADPTPSNQSVSPLVSPRTTRWKEREYDVDAAIPILMPVIQDHSTAPAERAAALDRLGVLSIHLRGRRCIDDLVELYPTLEKTEERFGLLQCLVNSEDSRALPLLYTAASGDKDPLVRLIGAAGLATWNVRAGARELIELFVLDAPGPRGALGWGAVIAFDSENSRRGWGLPKEVADRADASLQGLSDAQLRQELQRRYRQWFEQNQDRFPDWKPGDPLPASEPQRGDEQKPAPEPK